MTAQELYITGVLESFSTFCERSNVPTPIFHEAQLGLVSLLNSLDTKKGYLNDVAKFTLEFQKKAQVGDLALSLLTQFVKSYPPFQTAVFLRQYLLAVAGNGCSPSTIKNYRSDINQFFIFCENNQVEIIFAKPKVLSFLRNEQISGASSATLKRKLSSLTQFGLWLSDMGIFTRTSLKWLTEFKANQKFEAEITATKARTETENSFKRSYALSKLLSFSKLLPQTNARSAYAAQNDAPPTRSNYDVTQSSAQSTTTTTTLLLGATPYASARHQEHNHKLKAGLLELHQKLNKKTNQWLYSYLNVAFIALFVIGLSYFGYLQFFVQPPATLAYPTVLTRPNRTLSFQGRLTDTAQNPITSATNFRFRLYDSGPSIVGGTSLWDSGTCSVTPDQDGIFSTGLGSDCGSEIASSVFSENANVWLQVEVAAETLSPRQSIKSVAYSLNSETLQGYPPGAGDIATANTVVVMNSSGEVVLGTSTPKIKASTGTLTLEGTAVTLQTTSNGNIALSPNGTGTIIASRYISAPGATLSATYAGGTALVTRGGPSGTASIQEWQNNSGTPLSIVNSAGNFGIGTSTASQKLTVAGDAQISNYLYFGNGTTEYVRWDTSNFIVSDDILPSANNANDIGASGTRWNNIYGTTIDGVTINATTINGTTINQNGNQVCDTSGNCTTSGLWQNTSNVFHPRNEWASVTDLVIGGNSTASADFRVQGMNSATDSTLAGYTYGRRFLDIDGSSYYIEPADTSTSGLFAGNIGIGTTSASSAQLDLVNAGASNLLMRLNNGTAQAKFEVSTTNVAKLGTTTNHSFEFITNNTTRFKVMNGGNVGIASTNPTALLDLAGDASTSGSLVFRGSTPATIDILNGSRLDFQTSPGGDANLAAKMTILSDGNVGIGTTAPTQVLDVNGDLRVRGNDITDSADTTRITLGATTTLTNTTTTLSGTSTVTASSLSSFTTSAALAMNSTTSLTLGDDATIYGSDTANGDLTLAGTSNGTTTTSYVLLQPAGGNVGVGTTAPGVLFDIDDNAVTGTGLRVSGGGGGTNLALFTRDVGGNTNVGINGSGADAQIYFETTGNTFSLGTDSTSFKISDNNAIGTNDRLTILSNGNIGIGTDTPSQLLHVAGNLRVTGAFYDASNSAGSSGYVLTSTGTGTAWTNPESVLDSGWWDNTLNVLHPRGEYAGIADLVVGGTSTASADFRVQGMNSATDSTLAGYAYGRRFLDIDDTTYYVEPGNTTLSALFARNVGIATTSPNAALDISQGTMTMLLGADSGAVTRTNSTNKISRISSYHYTNAEEPMGVLYAESQTAANFIRLGGGSSLLNAATQIDFYTAANNTTTTGTSRMTIISDGNVGIGTTTPDNKLEIFSGTTPQLKISYDASNSTTVSVSSTGNLTIAPSGGAANITGTLDVSSTAAIGSAASINTNRAVSVDNVFTDLSATNQAGYFLNQSEPTVDSTVYHYGTYSLSRLDTGFTVTGLRGALGQAILNHNSGIVTNLEGVYGSAILNDTITGTVTSARGVYGLTDAEDGTITTGYGVYAVTPAVDTGTVTTGYGLYVAQGAVGAGTKTDQYGLRISTLTNAAGNNYGIWGDGGDWILDQDGDGASGGTSGGGDLIIGEGQDLELYHDGTNSYIVNNTGDLLINGAAGSNDVVLQSAGGNVGIGTATPSQALHVQGNARITGALYDSSNSAGSSGYVLSSTGTGTAWTNPESILDSGWWDNTLNVLHPRAEYAGIADLVVGGTSTASANFQVIGSGANAGYTYGRRFIDIDAQTYYVEPGNTSVAAAFAGNVGIGTTTPTLYNLQIKQTADSTIYLESDTASGTEDNNSFIKFSQDAAGVQSILGTVGNAGSDPENVAYTNTLGNATLLGTLDSNGALQFGTNDTVRMTIASAGNIGIAATTPTQMLDVNGDLRVRGNDITDSADTTRLTIGATTTLTNTTTTLSGTTTLTASTLDTFTTAATLNMSSTTALNLGTNAAITLGASTGGTVYGSSAASGDLTLEGTSNGTKTTSYVLLQPTTGNVGINTTAPTAALNIANSTGIVVRPADGAANTTVGLDVINRAGVTGTNFSSTYLYNSVDFDSGNNNRNAAFRQLLQADYTGDTTYEVFAMDFYGDNHYESQRRGAWLYTTGALYLQAGLTEPSSRSASNADTANAQFTLLSTGNVGIGTITPLGKLQVTGDEVRIGAAGTLNFASADGDLYVQDTIEADGSIYQGGNQVCDTSGNCTSSGLWQNTSNVFHPRNEWAGVADVVVGGTSTASADFRVQGMNSATDSTLAGYTYGRRFLDIDDTTYYVEPGNTTLSALFARNVGIATTSPNAALDISQGTMTMLLGADNSAVTRTNTTTKQSRIGQYHYTNSEEPMAVIFSQSQSGSNLLSLGGGSSLLNAATQIDFYTAANNTTTTGTSRMTVLSGGNVGVGTTSPGALLHSFATTEQLRLSYDASNYTAFTAKSNGDVHIDPTGALYLNGSYGASNSMYVGANGNFTLNSSSNTTFTGTGNVGIGSTTAGKKLDITDGVLRVSGAISDTVAMVVTPTVTSSDTTQQQLVQFQGTLAPSGASLTNSYALINLSTINTSSANITTANGTYSRIDLGAGYSGAVTTARAFNAGNSTVSGGSIATLVGYYVGDLTSGTNNYGIQSAVSSGANKYNIYASGTAVNYFAGNVGIGTATTTNTLDVNGTVRVRTFGGAASTNVCTDVNGVLSSCSGAWVDGAGTLNYLARWTDVDTLSIGATYDDGTNVGIGTSVPTAKLDVSGDASLSASLVFRNASPTVDVLNNGRLDFQTSPGGDANLAAKMTLTGAGNFGIGTTDPVHLIELNGASANAANGIGFGTAGTIDTELFRAAASRLDLGSGDNLNIPSATVSTGNGLSVVSTTTTLSTGKMLNISKTGASGSNAFTGDIVGVAYSHTLNAGVGLDSTGNVLDISRAITLNNAGNTHTISGALMTISDTMTQTAGTLTHTASVMDATQNYTSSTGTAFYFKNYGAGDSFRVDDVSGDTTPFIISNDGNVGVGTTTVPTGSKIATYLDSSEGSYNDIIVQRNNGRGTIQLEGSGDGAVYSELVLGRYGSTPNWSMGHRSDFTDDLIFHYYDGASYQTSIRLSQDGDVFFSGDAIPFTNDVYNLGADTQRWKDLYLGGETLHIGTSITDEGTFAYDTTTNILGISTDSTTNGDIAFFTDDLYLDKSSANVGIGTTGPIRKFHVNGGSSDVTMRLDTTSADPNITLTTLTQKDWSLGIDFSDSGKFKIDDTTTVGGSTRLTIDTGGNVGIGSTSPGNLLDINTTGLSSGINLDGRAAVTGYSTDSWLRLNNDSSWGSGVYTPGVFRSDGGYQTNNASYGSSNWNMVSTSGMGFNALSDSDYDFLIYDGGQAYTDDIILGYDLAGSANSALLTTYDTNENLVIDPNGSGYTYIQGGTFYVEGQGIFRTGIQDDGGNLLLNDTVNTDAVYANSGNWSLPTTGIVTARIYYTSVDNTGDLGGYVIHTSNTGGGTANKGMLLQAGHNTGSGTSTLIAFYDGDGTSLGDVTFTGGTITYGTFTGSHNASIPESDNPTGYPYGTLLCFDQVISGDDKQPIYGMQKCTDPYQPTIAGIYGSKFDDKPNKHLVFAVGDGHALVTFENGPIKKGDSITSSSYSGYGMKAVQPGVILGTATDDLNEGNATETVTLSDGRTVRAGLVPVYYYPGVFYPGQNSHFNTEGELVLNGSTGNYAVTPVNSGALSNIIAAATGVFGKVKAGLVTTQELVVEQSAQITALTTENLTTNTATISGSLSAPVAIIETLNTNNLNATGTTSLGSLLTETATISGTVTAENLDVTGSTRLSILQAQQAEFANIKATTADLMNATISGTLYAENIYDLNGKIAAALQEPSIIDLITGNLPEPLPEADPVSVYDDVQAAGYTINPDILAITGSEISLVNGDVLLTAQAAYVEKYLQVNGLAYIAQSLGVGENIIIGNTTTLTDRSIAFTPTTQDDITFYFQPTGQGKLDFLAGVMTIENGKVAITGSLTVAGTTKTDTLLTNLVQPADFGNPFQVQVAGVSTESGQLQKSRFEIINELGTPVATISAEGKANFAGGIGVGNETIDTPSVASGSSATVTASKSSGKAKLGAHSTQLTIQSDQISENSLVYVTPVGSTQNQVMYVKSQTAENAATSEKEGQFVVGFDQAIGTDVSFNWWIVN